MNKRKELCAVVNQIVELFAAEPDLAVAKRLWESAQTLGSIVEEWEDKGAGQAVEIAWAPDCLRCGKCCKQANGILRASINDIALWIWNGRFDVLEWVNPVIVPTGDVVAFDLWIDPVTKDATKECPWLRKSRSRGRYECAIHDVKPEACKKFPREFEHAKRVGCPAAQIAVPRRVGKIIRVSRAPDDERG